MTASTSTILPTLTSEFTEAGYIVSGQEHIGGIRRQIIREKVVHATTTAATNLTQKIPANSVVRAVQMKTSAGVTLTTGTHVSIGISGDLDVYGIVAAAGINAANETYYNTAILVTPVAVASETTVAVSATNSGGSASGTFLGTVVVEITIDTYVGIADF